jgi:hypothetical protein
VQCRRRASRAYVARIGLSGLLSAVLGVLATLALPPCLARADEPNAGTSFDFGLAEMLAGRYASGCPALESSFRSDPRPGTLFTLADCDRKWGKTASALARYVEFLALYERMPPDQRAKQKERAAIATDARATLERTTPLLSVRLPADAPPGTRVWRDDVELSGPALSAAMPMDPGEHTVRAETPAGRARAQRVTLASGEQKTIVVDLTPDTAAPSPAPPPEPAVAPAPSVPAPASEAQRPSHAGWSYAAAGVTVAAGILAGVTGGLALSQRSTTLPVCNAEGICTTQQGVNAGNEARTLANVETGALVVAGVALVATVVLFATEPRGRARGVSFVRGAGGGGIAW